MSANEIAAWWGAIIATLVLIWDVFKWKQKGPRLRLTVTPDKAALFEAPNADPDNLYILIELINLGDKKIELKHVAGFCYKSFFQRIKGKKEQNFATVNPAFSTKLPCFLEPGERWIGGLYQSQELEELSNKYLLYCGIFHSASKKPITMRVTIKKKAASG